MITCELSLLAMMRHLADSSSKAALVVAIHEELLITVWSALSLG